jgi:hypothetical protein
MAMSSRARSDWSSGIPAEVPPAAQTEFEILAGDLNLTEQSYSGSQQLKKWCEDNRNRRFVPEWLLKEWGIRVDSERLSI